MENNSNLVCTDNSNIYSCNELEFNLISWESILIYLATNGAIILSRYGYTSSSYYYGIVSVYYNNGCGNICDDYYYSSTEANVICHQLGYTGASSHSRAGLVKLEFIIIYVPRF